MTDTKNSYTPYIIMFVIGIAAMLAGTYFSGNLGIKPKPTISGTFFDKPKSVQAFTLTDHNNKEFNASSLKGKWSFIFFGYTNCPDICPQTMNVMKVASIEFAKLPTLFANTQYVFVSVDPNRDTAEKLKKYVGYYGKNFVGITGKPDTLTALAKQFHTHFMTTIDKDPAKYKVEHGGHIMLINPQGKWQALFSYPHSATKMVYDYHSIRAYFKK